MKVLIVYPGFVMTKISENALSGNGVKHGKMDEAILKGIDPNEYAIEILNAIMSEKKEMIIAGPKEKFGIFLHKYFPNLFASFIARTKVT
ncbi:hypothetical protein [Leptospira saintgironsiae]|uniref:hypothetical protein n=1 Tax=Leptospira saintgironsiae TaxID=2023183 RepID=UPI001FCA61AA|nr:hypothetical protein [Leptospira saintgironsiae]